MSVFYHEKDRKVRGDRARFSRLAAVVFLCVGLLALAGCGKKPGHVDPPDGAADTSQQIYPDLRNDPLPDDKAN